MRTPTPYTASPDELAAIDEALAGDAISAEKLGAHYGDEAARLRRDADSTGTADLRIALLNASERLDKLAVALSSC